MFDHHYVELKPSLVCDGVGVFAIKHIPKDIRIFQYAPMDVFYSWDQVTDPAVKKLIKRICHTNDKGFWIADHPSTLGMSYYVNHSESPNVKYDDDLDDYISIREINEGEELVCIYDKDEKDWLS